jgi:energy-coupling factor transport system substrate-specific component
VSWQLGAAAILALALAGGFAWYERARPDARTVALVATLAALGALGRIAFAALPNVKPTTDIVLISGWALGGPPGFVVGAVAALTSNFFFGQGPWTPWQMAGWGATGLIGAALRPLFAQRLPRFRLAVICAIVGYAFTALQDAGDWVTYSDHSLAQLGAYVGQGMGFDLIHAAGCVAFALAFGPALGRTLRRLEARRHVTWLGLDGRLTALLATGSLAGALAGAGLLSAGVAPVRAAGDPVSAAAGYLLSAQNPDGGLGAAGGQPSSPMFSGWAALGLAAAGHNPADVVKDGHSLLSYLESSAAAGRDPGSLERTILVAGAAGADPRSFGAVDLLAALARDLRPDGSVSDQVNLTAFAVLALRAAGAPVPQRTIGWLLRQQDSDGGFNFATGGGGAVSDPDDTGAALEALAGVPGARATRVRARAVSYLRSVQNPDGGFPATPGAGSNAQSTAFAVQGLIAAGVSPGALRRSPIAYLQSLIAPDGAVRYSRAQLQTPVWVTGEALMALAGKPLPLAAVPRAPAAARRSAAGPSHRSGRRLATPSRPRHSVRRARRHSRAKGSDAGGALASDAGFLTGLALGPAGM